ncbi:hypothetical protein M405DRAFT_704375, partial [Rhizopogon salebrosus TDB-379]
IEACIERSPDMYINELEQELLESAKIDVSEDTILRTLRRRGFVRKMVSQPAVERNEDRRDTYRILVSENY